MGGAQRYLLRGAGDVSNHVGREVMGFASAQPILVIAKSITVCVFRKEWPAADCNPRQAAGDRIEPILSSLWLPCSVIAPAHSSDPDGCRNNLVRFTRQGRGR